MEKTEEKRRGGGEEGRRGGGEEGRRGGGEKERTRGGKEEKRGGEEERSVSVPRGVVVLLRFSSGGFVYSNSKVKVGEEETFLAPIV